MEIKKANLEYSLMFLKQLKIDNLPLDNCVYDMRKNCGDIIDLLEEGNKYKQIWKQFKKKYAEEYIIFEGGDSVEIAMDELEKKYLHLVTDNIKHG